MLTILGRYVGARLTAADLVREPGGKPRLRDVTRSLGFNLSHTHGLALVAIGPYPRIGVDVEVRRRLSRILPIARRILSDAETRELEALPEAARPARFLQFWTAMEARQKAFGLGILAPAVDPAEVWSHGFVVGNDAWGHVAVANSGTAPRLRFFDEAA
jgi:4'-phosphopantetheinyl transferase